MHCLFRKQPSEIEIYNDINGGLVNFFKVVKTQPEELCHLLDFTLYSREVFLNALNTQNEGTELERACKFYILNRQSFAGKMKNWAITTTGAKGFSNFKDRIWAAYERIKAVYIENLDYRKIIKKYDAADTFFLLDPPYVFNENRSKSKIYDNEMTNAQHEELATILTGITGKFILCGYDNNIYSQFDKMPIGVSNMNISKTVGKERIKKQEYVWKNF